MKADTRPPAPRIAMPEREFIALMAMLVAMTALSIDIMLPALPAIAQIFSLDDANDRQGVVTAFILGFAVGQPFFGPLADRYGRVRPLAGALLLVLLMSFAAAFATDFNSVLAARFVQGLGGAGARVIAIAIIRDRFGGRDMARVMSVIMSVFIIVPVVAPSAGGVLVALGHWQWTFYAIAVFTVLLLTWVALRLPETLSPDHVGPTGPVGIARSMLEVARDRTTLAYSTGQGFLLGGLFAYIGSAQQVFTEVYGLGDLFPIAFGAMALGIVAASLTNSRIVGRVGMRPISRLASTGYIAVTWLHAVVALAYAPPLPVFGVLLTFSLFLFGMMMPNLNALAMEPHGARAGIASSFVGFYTTLLGAIIGGTIGQLFDGTVLPLVLGYAVLSVLTRLAIAMAPGFGESGDHSSPPRRRH